MRVQQNLHGTHVHQPLGSVSHGISQMTLVLAQLIQHLPAGLGRVYGIGNRSENAEDVLSLAA